MSMTIDNIRRMVQNRIALLESQRAAAETSGNIEAVSRCDSEIAEAVSTLAQLPEEVSI